MSLAWFINHIRRKDTDNNMEETFVGMEDEDPKRAAEEWEAEQAKKGSAPSTSVPDEATGGGGGAAADPATPGPGGASGEGGGASQGGGSTGEGGGASQGGGTGNP